MEVKIINEKSIWENFLLECKDKTFLDSWNWGEFQKRMGNKIWRLGIFDRENLVGIALITKIKAKRGTFLLIQHGPAFAPASAKATAGKKASEGLAGYQKEVFEIFLQKLKEIGKEERAIFIRMNPLWECNRENQNILRDLGFKGAPMHANAYEATWKLDITIPEEELLKNMRKTTRYLIRQGMKNQDIIVEKSERLDDIEKYQKLNKEIAKRQKFVPFSFEYVKNEFEVFSPDNQVLLFFGKYKEKIISSALVIFWSGIGFYHQAASSSKYTKFSIPYLLLWEAIKEAKKRGCILYDFWGYVDPFKNPKHPWAGPTLFKMGFGGKPYEYVKTQDFPLSKKYWLTYIFEKLRKAKRGL